MNYCSYHMKGEPKQQRDPFFPQVTVVKSSCGQEKLWSREDVLMSSCGQDKLWSRQVVVKSSGQVKMWSSQVVLEPIVVKSSCASQIVVKSSCAQEKLY